MKGFREILKPFVRIGEVGQDIAVLVLFVAYLVALSNLGLTSLVTKELRTDMLLIAFFFWVLWVIHTIFYVNFERALKKYRGTKYQVDVIK